MPLSRVCVFCGSSTGGRAAYQAAAAELGRGLAARGLGLVYGGSNTGLMRVVADEALAAGGEVIGVMPSLLNPREMAHRGLTDLRIVSGMHERKAAMAELADAFVALPGGVGTLDELCEVLTSAQIGLHRKPCALLNVDGYYDGLLALLDRARHDGFIAPTAQPLLVSTDVGLLLDALTAMPPGGRVESGGVAGG
jgi:hypothetical protein